MPRGSRHFAITVCAPAGTVMRSRPWSGFAGRDRPETVTSCTSASPGSVSTSASSRLARVVTVSDVVVSRSPGVVSSRSACRVRVCPGTAGRVPEAERERLAGPGPDLRGQDALPLVGDGHEPAPSRIAR